MAMINNIALMVAGWYFINLYLTITREDEARRAEKNKHLWE